MDVTANLDLYQTKHARQDETLTRGNLCPLELTDARQLPWRLDLG